MNSATLATCLGDHFGRRRLFLTGIALFLTTMVISSVDADHVGPASGFNSAVARVGGLIATALLGFVFAQQGSAMR